MAVQQEVTIRLMVMGMPNVGKSSLINALRRSYSKRGLFTACYVSVCLFVFPQWARLCRRQPSPYTEAFHCGRETRDSGENPFLEGN